MTIQVNEEIECQIELICDVCGENKTFRLKGDRAYAETETVRLCQESGWEIIKVSG